MIGTERFLQIASDRLKSGSASAQWRPCRRHSQVGGNLAGLSPNSNPPKRPRENETAYKSQSEAGAHIAGLHRAANPPLRACLAHGTLRRTALAAPRFQLEACATHPCKKGMAAVRGIDESRANPENSQSAWEVSMDYRQKPTRNILFSYARCSPRLSS
jgi:hypothetical protein